MVTTDKPRRFMRPAQPGEYTLGTTSEPWICLECTKCERWGEYKRESLVAEFGADTLMPDLLRTFARARGCLLAKPVADPYLLGSYDCGIRYRVEVKAFLGGKRAALRDQIS